jgi:alpha-ketoglutaric semialdehyde dehydrogenase
MEQMTIVTLTNRIGGRDQGAADGRTIDKFAPHDGRLLWRIPRSGGDDVAAAVTAAAAAQPAWAELTPVKRGSVLADVVAALRARRDEMARVVADETGKSVKDALGETGGAAQLGEFFAGEGMRLFGRSLPSGSADKYCMTVRQPLGVAGLIVPANTPIANVAWKTFPALICGNAVVLKAAEDTPRTASLFEEIARSAGLPDGVLNIVHGLGGETGPALVADPRVNVISFTGSTAVGRGIAEAAGRRLARVSLELGGKNPLVVCDDADLDNAVKWTLLSAFSNAGQRCAAASRILVFDAVYDRFRTLLLERASALRVGPGDSDDLGAVINERQLTSMQTAVDGARGRGAAVSLGGHRLTGPEHAKGYYMAPTVLENVAREDVLSTTEVFGPITTLYRVNGFADALEFANHGPYGLTAAIHTRDINRAVHFAQRVRAGVVNINVGTYGSEPHMPFGGFGQSGNGTREPGTEALDVYSELKNIAFTVDRDKL